MPFNEQHGDESSIERALQRFAEIADLPAAEQRQRLDRIEQSDVRASVEELLAGDRTADERLERCMVAVAALHERASSGTHIAAPSILRFVLERVRREARTHGSDWTPPNSLETTLRSLLHAGELSDTERAGLRQPDLRRGTDSIAGLIALRTEASLSIALAEARDAQAIRAVPNTSILVLRDDVDTQESGLEPFVEIIRQHLDDRAPSSDRLAVLAEPAAFVTLSTQLRARRVDAPAALSFHAGSDLADGTLLGRDIAKVEVSELDDSCQAIEDCIFGLIKAPQDSSRGSVDRWVGRLLHDKYRILDVIGTGGFGTVYEARDERGAGNIVAIKILKPHVAERPHLLQAFKNEARRATRLNHPNIVDWKVFDETSDGTQYFVMERLVGEELADLLEREGSLPPDRATRILIGITEALCAAHHLGPDEAILHLDLKPANIFVLPPEVASAERIKVLDFGIGQYVGGEEGELAAWDGAAGTPPDDACEITTAAQRTSLVVRGLDRLPTPIDDEGRRFHRSTACTPEYAAPEHCEHVLGRERIVPLDGRCDLFSLGVLAFRMLTGEMPFPAGAVRTDLIRMHAEEQARKIATTDVSLPKNLAQFVDRCLELEREHRFESAQEALEHLRSVVQRPVRTLAWIAALVAILGAAGVAGFASGWFKDARPRLELLEGTRRLDPGEQLFFGPARDEVVLSLAEPWVDRFNARSLRVRARAAQAPNFTARWSDSRSIELCVASGPEAGWSGAIEIEDPAAQVEFPPIDVVWIGPNAWALAQVSIDHQVRAEPSTLFLGPSCQRISIRVGATELIGRAGVIERVDLKPVHAAGQPARLTRRPSDPRAFEAEFEALAPGDAWTLVALDRAGRTELLATLEVVPALALKVAGFQARVDGLARRFDQDDSGVQRLFPGTQPRLALSLRRPEQESAGNARVDAELAWVLRTESDPTPLWSQVQRIDEGPFEIPLTIDDLRTSTTYVLEISVNDDRVAHAERDARRSETARFVWDATPAWPRARLGDRELEPGRVHYTREQNSSLTFEEGDAHGWLSTYSLDGEPQHGLKLAFKGEGRYTLRVEHRRTSARGIVSNEVFSESYEVAVDTHATRIARLGVEAETAFKEPADAIEIPVLLDPASMGEGRVDVRAGAWREGTEQPYEFGDWRPWSSDASTLSVQVPWQRPRADGPYRLRVQTRDEAGNMDELEVRVHAALEPPNIEIEEPASNAVVWESAREGHWNIAVQALDSNGVAAVTARVGGSLPDGELTRTVQLVRSSSERWTGTVRYGHEWSNAALSLEINATDAHGRVGMRRANSSLRLPTIEPAATISAQRESASTGTMRLVPGNRVGSYVFMGRDQRTESAMLERALGALSAARRVGRRDPYWRIEFDEGAIADFYLDEHEVSNEQFLRFVRAHDGYRHSAHWPSADSPDETRFAAWIERSSALAPDLPVIGVTWSEAHAFAHWAGKRLPSLVEWEYAARGGQRYRAFAAEDVATFASSAELAEKLNVRWDGPARTVRPVASGDDRTADTGLFDLTGNVREWTSSACPEPTAKPRDHALEHPELQLRPERRPDWDRQRDYWCAGSCMDSRRIEFNTLRRMPREAHADTLGFRCALSVSAYRTARLAAGTSTTFEPREP